MFSAGTSARVHKTGGAAASEGFATLAEAAAAAPASLSTLLAAVTAAELTEPLSDPDTTWTVFAPTDEVCKSTGGLGLYLGFD